MAKQVSFDFFAAMLYTLLKGTDIDMKWVVSVAAAASASVLACTFSQPGDMVRLPTKVPRSQRLYDVATVLTHL